MLKLPETVLPVWFPMWNGKLLYVSDVQAMCQTIEVDENLRRHLLNALNVEGKVLLLLVSAGLALCEEGFVEKEPRVIGRMEEIANCVEEMEEKTASAQVLAIQAWLNLPNVTPTHALWNQTMTLLSASAIPTNAAEA